MVWSHSDNWMLTADHAGFVKYWQSNMNNVKMYQAHKDPVRGLRLVYSGAIWWSNHELCYLMLVGRVDEDEVVLWWLMCWCVRLARSPVIPYS